jgi:hypothetical protein
MLDFVMIFLIATHGWLNGKILKNELFASFDLFVLCGRLLPLKCSYFSMVVSGRAQD